MRTFNKEDKNVLISIYMNAPKPGYAHVYVDKFKTNKELTTELSKLEDKEEDPDYYRICTESEIESKLNELKKIIEDRGSIWDSVNYEKGFSMRTFSIKNFSDYGTKFSTYGKFEYGTNPPLTIDIDNSTGYRSDYGLDEFDDPELNHYKNKYKSLYYKIAIYGHYDNLGNLKYCSVAIPNYSTDTYDVIGTNIPYNEVPNWVILNQRNIYNYR